MIAKSNKPPMLLLAAPHPGLLLRARQRVEQVALALQKRLTIHNLLLAVGVSLPSIALLYGVVFFWPRTIAFSYAGSNCLTQPTVLPRLISQTKNSHYTATYHPSVSVAGYPLYSQVTCVAPVAAPQENHTDALTLRAAIFQKRIRVRTNTFPALASQATLEKPVPVQESLKLQLTSYDSIFDYRLRAGDRTATCSKQDSSLSCDVPKMALNQSARYEFSLERQFDGQAAGAVFNRTLTTVESVSVVGSTISPGQTVYHIPTELTLTLNRPATSAQDVHVYLAGATKQEVPTTHSLKDKSLTIHFTQPLLRNAAFTMSVGSVRAEDGGSLAIPATFDFKTSGGPKVLGVNIGSYRVSQTSGVTIRFDSDVSPTQATQFVGLEAGGAAVAASVSVSGNSVTIRPNSPLPKCAALTVKVADGLQNTYGVSGGSAWQFKSRTICQTVFSIGTSVQGRGISAYSFGSGPSKIVFVGGTHGDEQSSVIILNRLIDYLEASANIPAGRTIIIIPTLNPDGYAASRRTNAHGVDLNRNFPANNWKSGVTMPDKSFNPTGGGTAPLSEPESAALASYVSGQNPALVLTYHAIAGVVMPNGSGNSDALARLYDQKSNVGYAPSSANGEIFEYDTTGAFEDWLHDKRGTPALLVELWTKSGNEYAQHQAAMLAVMQ